jgi:DNA polymerase-3 subunit epsilon
LAPLAAPSTAPSTAPRAIGQQQSFDALGTPLFEVPFCILDLETTGGSPADCDITEIGAVRYIRGEHTGTFQTLVDPGRPIPPLITILTGITQAMVTTAPQIDAALPALLEFVGDAVIVGHNIRFDMSFLNAAANRLGYGRLLNRTVDTAALARRLIRSEVRNLKLGTLAAYFRSPVTPNHRALEDARATAHVLFELLERVGTMGVSTLEDLLALPTAKGAPSYSKLSLTEGIPRSPGVYLFRDRDDEVLYVGKAKNLRNRVRSYFYGDTRRRIADMLRQLERIDHIVCATEIEASITEVRLIHAHRPRFNRRSRPPKANHFLVLTDEAFPRLSIVRRPRGAFSLGPFRTQRSAKIVQEAIWDAIPIRRCTGRPGSRSGPCAPAQMGVAMCPCAGTLAPERYGDLMDLLCRAIDEGPRLLLDRLADKVRSFAADQRYEEAGWARDRYHALAQAIERRRAWMSLVEAGRIHAEAIDAMVCIDRGRFVAAWRHGTQPPLLPAGTGRVFADMLTAGGHAPADEARVPPDAATAEEAALLWAWMTSGDARLIESERPLRTPAGAVPELAMALRSIAA